VQLAGSKFLTGEYLLQTHVTVEAWIDGKWETSDPLFNVSIACSDAPKIHLSIPEATACLARGNSFVLLRGRTEGSPDRPDGTKMTAATSPGKISSDSRGNLAPAASV
jgi:hypothetical protein